MPKKHSQVQKRKRRFNIIGQARKEYCFSPSYIHNSSEGKTEKYETKKRELHYSKLQKFSAGTEFA